MQTNYKRVGGRCERSGTDRCLGISRPPGRCAIPVKALSNKRVDGATDKLADPEEKFRRYGAHYGGAFKLDWLAAAPRVRIRTNEDRKIDDIVELAVLNERLSGGMPAWEARRRLDYLKMRKRNWELIYEYVTSTDAVATLELIEEANRKVEAILSEEAQEKTSVSDLKQQLVQLQAEMDGARQKLQLTEARVQQNLERVNALKAEAAILERLRSTPTEDTQPANLPTTASVSAPTVERAVSTLPRSKSSAGTSTSRSSLLAPPAPARPGQRWKQGRGLHSSLEIEDQLRNFWIPAEFSKKLSKDTLVPFDLFGEAWVLFRDEHGQPACIKDTCAHRACPLSLGTVVDGHVSCAYHGWEFNGEGTCTKMPSTKHCKSVAVAALPCTEKDGFIWVWPGNDEAPEVPDFTRPPPGFEIHAEIMVEVPVEHGLLIENLLDLAHAPFTHTSTFARGWPIPDAVKFHASKILSGNWDPYPINMGFQPPCMTVSMIGLAQPGKIMRGVTAEQCDKHLHQLHVCMPSRKGHTRLLYRMSLDFMGYLKYIPFIDKVWQKVAAQVLGEDLVLVIGQQDRMQRGDDTWSNPVAYDKLAVRYRRWRNSIAAGDQEAGSEELRQAAIMSAGEMFSDSE